MGFFKQSFCNFTSAWLESVWGRVVEGLGRVVEVLGKGLEGFGFLCFKNAV